tara:strand:+ start:214 stop:549 length:336 start_codon:yes stop_codon:yes gene_type:complete
MSDKTPDYNPDHNSDHNVIDKTTIHKIAKLARIEIAPEREDALCGELSTIISWVEQLGECDTAHVEPLASVTGHSLPMRDDVVTSGDDPDAVLSNAPEEASHFFVVPKVVE